MTYKLLQLNIFKGKFLDKIAAFVRQEKFDFCHFQEVSGGKLNFNNDNAFRKLEQLTGYKGKLAICWRLKNNPNTYFANATFWRPEYKPGKNEIVWLKAYREVTRLKSRSVAADPRCALAVNFILKGRKVTLINTHLAWGPTAEDKPYKIRQGNRLAAYIKDLSCSDAFILSGDFNLTTESVVLKNLNRYSRNLAEKKGISNTLNPKEHYASQLFPPGLAVDHLFVSDKIRVKKFKLLSSPTLSDHLGLVLEFSLK